MGSRAACILSRDTHNPQVEGSEQPEVKKTVQLCLSQLFSSVLDWRIFSNNLSKTSPRYIFHRTSFLGCYSELSNHSIVCNLSYLVTFLPFQHRNGCKSEFTRQSISMCMDYISKSPSHLNILSPLIHKSCRGRTQHFIKMCCSILQACKLYIQSQAFTVISKTYTHM